MECSLGRRGLAHVGWLIVQKTDQKRARLFARNGHDWTDGYPLIVEAALRPLRFIRYRR